MKKLLVLLLVVFMMSTVVACGTSESQDDFNDVVSATSNLVSDLLNGNYDSDKVESAMDALNSAAQDVGAKLDISIAEYVNELKASDDFKQMAETLKQQYLSVEVVAEGNNLVYKYTYTVEIDIEATKQALEALDNSAMESSTGVLHTILTKLDKVIVEYYSKEGTLLHRVEF